jgi:hypothetical protein
MGLLLVLEWVGIECFSENDMAKRVVVRGLGKMTFFVFVQTHEM